MALSTGFLVRRLQASIDEAIDLTSHSEASTTFVNNRRLYVYEAAYLLCFCAWENFLEETFLRFLCGYENAHGRATLLPGRTYANDLSAARLMLFGTGRYLLWHSPDHSIKRSQKWFDASGGANAPLQSVPASARTDLDDFAAIRHFIAHRSSDARTQFDSAVLRLSGAGVLGSRAGRFLRQSTLEPATGMTMPWIQRIASDLVRFASQIAN